MTGKHSRDRARRLVPWYTLFARKKIINSTTRRVPYRIDLLHNQRNCYGKMIVMDTGIGSVFGFN